ncbi:MAG: hypothetical protein OXQ96_04630, partial [Alphaproteobacteria bacterium]|nr:hypothetical protein [Alphaproteobacteria bacterium]
LIYKLCNTYKSYTGKLPISWNTGTSAFNSNQFTGDILPFLEIILPHTAYKRSLSHEALQVKLKRMSKTEEFKDMWQRTKK